MVSDSVIFVRNPACNNYHGTSAGVSPSPPVTLAPTPTASPPPTTGPVTTPSPAASTTPVPTVVPTQPTNPLQVNPVKYIVCNSVPTLLASMPYLCPPPQQYKPVLSSGLAFL